MCEKLLCTPACFPSLCPQVNHPVVCGIHRVPCNFNDPQHVQISCFTSCQPPDLFSTSTATCLVCDQYVASWNEATGSNVVL